MNSKFKKTCLRAGFTLAETLVALTVGSMILIVVLTFYGRAQTGAADIISKMQGDRLPREVLQRIAEDLDRVVGGGQGIQINIMNKFQDGLAGARIEITRIVYNAKDEAVPLEQIVWQSSIDPDSGVLTLYRSHSGIALEDKLLDEQKEPWQRELFVPVCTGLSFFRIEIPQGENPPLDIWSGEKMPAAINVILSFAQPSKMPDGTYDVPEEGKLSRTFAIDRTRMPAFVMPVTDANQPADANRPADANQPVDANQPANEGVN